ncbi:MAG: MBL fold metallo-hydrolase, partial [Leptolyngbya sp.]|nr:MBL fold metallo-hydrolase [Candidatus Melainabacteria bacterium]
MALIFEPLTQQGCMSYLIASSDAREAWIVDPSLKEAERYIAMLKERGYTLKAVIDTHAHADHLSGGAHMMDLTGCHYVMHESAKPKDVSDRIGEGAEMTLGGVKVRFIHTPGHTEDSMCIIFEDKILTGDTLFLDDGGAGRCDLPGGSAGDHFDSLQKLLAMSNSLIVYPGHDYRGRRPSTLGEQKQRNPFFKPKTRDQYVHFLEELKLGPAEWMKLVLEANFACTRDPKAVDIPQGVSACEVMGTMTDCASNQDIQYIDATEMKKRMDGGWKPVLLDVRETPELTAELGHLPGIKHISVREIACRLDEVDQHKDDEIVSICKMGGRAKTAAQVMA